MNLTTELRLDFGQVKTIPQFINVKQADVFTRRIRVLMFLDGMEYTPPENTSVVFRALRTDGVIVTIPCSVDGNVALVSLTQEATERRGACLCDIAIEDGGQILSSASFYMRVRHSPTVE